MYLLRLVKVLVGAETTSFPIYVIRSYGRSYEKGWGCIIWGSIIPKIFLDLLCSEEVV